MRVGNAAQQGAGLVFSNTNAKIPRSFLVKFSQSLQFPKQCCKGRYKYAIIPFLFSHLVGRQSVLSPAGVFSPKVITDNLTDLFIKDVEK